MKPRKQIKSKKIIKPRNQIENEEWESLLDEWLYDLLDDLSDDLLDNLRNRLSYELDNRLEQQLRHQIEDYEA